MDLADNLLGDVVGFLFVFVANGAEGHFALDGEPPQSMVADGALQDVGIGGREGARIGVGTLEGGDGVDNGRFQFLFFLICGFCLHRFYRLLALRLRLLAHRDAFGICVSNLLMLK